MEMRQKKISKEQEPEEKHRKTDKLHKNKLKQREEEEKRREQTSKKKKKKKKKKQKKRKKKKKKKKQNNLWVFYIFTSAWSSHGGKEDEDRGGAFVGCLLA